MEIIWKTRPYPNLQPGAAPVGSSKQHAAPVEIDDEVVLYVEGAAATGNDIRVRVRKIEGDSFEGEVTTSSTLGATTMPQLKKGSIVAFHERNIFRRAP